MAFELSANTPLPKPSRFDRQVHARQIAGKVAVDGSISRHTRNQVRLDAGRSQCIAKGRDTSRRPAMIETSAGNRMHDPQFFCIDYIRRVAWIAMDIVVGMDWRCRHDVTASATGASMPLIRMK